MVLDLLAGMPHIMIVFTVIVGPTVLVLLLASTRMNRDDQEINCLLAKNEKLRRSLSTMREHMDELANRSDIDAIAAKAQNDELTELLAEAHDEIAKLRIQLARLSNAPAVAQVHNAIPQKTADPKPTRPANRFELLEIER